MHVQTSSSYKMRRTEFLEHNTNIFYSMPRRRNYACGACVPGTVACYHPRCNCIQQALLIVVTTVGRGADQPMRVCRPCCNKASSRRLRAMYGQPLVPPLPRNFHAQWHDRRSPCKRYQHRIMRSWQHAAHDDQKSARRALPVRRN